MADRLKVGGAPGNLWAGRAAAASGCQLFGEGMRPLVSNEIPPATGALAAWRRRNHPRGGSPTAQADLAEIQPWGQGRAAARAAAGADVASAASATASQSASV